MPRCEYFFIKFSGGQRPMRVEVGLIPLSLHQSAYL